ncbi:hypothetical protein TUM4637_37290 [Shewanella hafniensis]|uniref:restriction endonuclease subunit S n=1 Tax=Shewanella hafniensis TaxID=365590 RepID=UPI001BB89515|nr:restriction endonuclease subunit S [Shewanella hafniensis]MCL1136670.1 restriction endonuclease subunit S [Shewanella hafniensis]GIU37614.1 hypothetical protein TUM4637_37290 [Shewanella hafniensis]
MSQAENQVIPEGYKQTEIGVIPDDWKTGYLGDSAKFIGSGKTNTKNKGDYSLYGSTGVIGSCCLPEYTGASILVARVGANAGKLGFADGEYGVSDNTIIIKLLAGCNLKYFQYWLTRRNLNSLVFGSGQPLITGSQLKELILPLPQLKEQTAIANALSDMDALLRELENLIAKKQAIKTAAMQQLLTGKTRLPQFAFYSDINSAEGVVEGKRKGTKPSELGEIPDDWEVKKFGQVMRIRHGKDQKSIQVSGGLYPIFGTGGQMGSTNTPLYDKPSVLIGRKGTINKPRFTDYPFWTVDTLFYSEVANTESVKFIYYKFCMIDWMQYNEASGVPSLNASTIENVLASFPDIKEQTAIVTILSDIDNEIQAFEQRLSKTRQIKQGMMQELLTGKTRLPLNTN